MPKGVIDYVIGMAVTAGINFALQWILDKPGRKLIAENVDGENIDIALLEADGTPYEPPTSEGPSESDPTPS